MRGPRAGIVLAALCACGGGAAPAGDATLPPGYGSKGTGPDKAADPGPPAQAERKLVAPIGDEPMVECQDRSDKDPEWREPPPPDKGYVRVDAVAFRSGCLSATLLDESIADREQDLVGCFDTRGIKDATVVIRTTWSSGGAGASLTKIDVRPAPGDKLPAGAAPLGSCLQKSLAGIHDLGPEPTLPAVVDVLLRRGFPEEVETLGID